MVISSSHTYSKSNLDVVDINTSNKINGKRFVVHGRAKKAELRGCSDVSN